LLSASSPTVCSGGSVLLSATGCAGSILWSNGQTGASIQVSPTLPVTSYTATCSVASCTSNASNPVTVTLSTGPNAPVISASNSNICVGQSTVLTATGCSGTVTWSNGQTGSSLTVSPLATSNYSATCALGSCVSNASLPLTINVGSVTTPTILASKELTCGGEPVNLTVSNCVGGVLWSTGATSLTISVSPTATTTYSVNCGTGTCASTAQKTITVGGLGQTPTLTASANNVCAGTPVTLTATNCTGTIAWAVTSNPGVSVGTGSSITVSPSATTSYTATCSSGTGCSGFASININVTSKPDAPIVTCGAERICAGDSLVFTAHNCAGTVNWSNGMVGTSMVVRPMVNTTYTATCTVNGCVSNPSIPVTITVLTQVPVITASSETVCSGGSTTLTASNCSGTLLWSTGSNAPSITVNPTAQTIYSVTCTVDGCVGTANKTIFIGLGQTPTITASQNSICAGAEVVLTASNCVGIATWSTGATGTSLTVSPTSTTNYSVTCGTASCLGTSSITITVNPVQLPSISTSNAFICAGESTTLTASGCSGGLVWSTGATTAVINVSPTANTIYTVTCGSGTCARSVSQEIIVNPISLPTLSASKSSICAGESVTLTATNCASTITWSTGQTGSSITVTPSANTTYNATCGTGSCIGSANITINVSSGQTPQISASSTTICANEQVTLNVSACTGSIMWSNGSTTASINVNPTVTTTYSVTCTSGACSGSASRTITVGTGQVPVISASAQLICAGQNSTLTVTNCSSTVSWSNGMTGSQIVVVPSAPTTYTATCGSGSCSASSSISIDINNSVPAPTVSANVTEICQPGIVILSATGCQGTITWSNGQTGNSITVNVETTQSFRAFCTGLTCISVYSEPVNITVGNTSVPVISSSGSTVCNGSSVTLTATNCSQNVFWSNGMTGSSIIVAPTTATNYSAICRAASANCDSQPSNIIRIDVSNAPNAPTITCSADRICQGESLTLVAIGCEGTVTWHSNGNTQTGQSIVVSPSVTTAYTATCTIGNCTSGMSGAATITVGKPIPPIVYCNSPVVCSGNSVEMEAYGCVGTVRWSNGMTGSVVSVSPTVLTTYYAICDAGACQSDQSNSISVVVSGSGIKKPTVRDLVNTCPNQTVDLSTAVTSTVANGNTLIFRTGNSPSSPAVQNPTSIGLTGTYYVFESGGSGCYSEGSIINVGITNCNDPVPNCTTNPATAVAGANETICLDNNYITLNGSIGGAATSSTWSSSGTGTFENSINPVTRYYFSNQDLVNGTVTLTLTTNDPDNAGSCLPAVSSKVVTINSVSVRPTISSNKSPNICLGDSVTLTANPEGNYSYLWSNGASTRSIEAKVSGNYSVRFVNQAGCKSLASDNISVDVNSSIAAPSVTSPVTNVCPATTVNLASAVTSQPITQGGIIEYHVSNSPTSNMLATTNAIGAGTYYVFEKTTTGCYSNSASIVVAIDNCEVQQGDADIQVNITGNKTTVLIGDDVIYTLQIKNNGASNATTVKIENVIPEGLSIVGATPGLMLISGKLVATIPTIAVGETKTYTYTAKLTKAGQVINVINKISADQSDPISSNNTDDFTIECLTCQETCIATSLKADTLRQSNGSYNVTFTALVKNCGNVPLSGVELDANLSGMFPNPTQFTVVQQPTPRPGSTIVGNPAFNGSTDKSVLNKLSSTLPVGKTDTVVFMVNLQPNGTEGPYSTNSIAKGIGLTQFGIAQDVSDVSNDGMVVVASLADPTVIRLFKSPSIAISLAIIDTTHNSNGTYDIMFQAIVKNNGSLVLNNVIVKDSLSKYFPTPVTYTLVSVPTTNLGSTLVINPAFNGSTEYDLTLNTSTLPIGKSDTIWYKINLNPGTRTEFENQAVVYGTGTMGNGSTETVMDVSNSGINPNEPGNNPTQLVIGSNGQGSEVTSCIGIALTSINRAKQEDGTYNITYQAIIKNCGNLNLSDISLCDTLSNTFSLPALAKVIGDPIVNAGSTLAPGKTDTLKWTINIELNSNNGPFRNNVIVTGKTPSGLAVSDTSNDGINPDPSGSTPTILNFNDNIPEELLGLAKELVNIKKVEGSLSKFDVEFKFVMKNYGIVSFNNLQLQDNLAFTFGDKVSIDSVYIKDASQGLMVTDNFTGKGQLTYMLVDSLSTLPISSTKSIGMIVRVDLANADTLVYENIAMISGKYPGGFESINDASTTGSNPDKDLSGSPLDDSEPTIIDFRGLYTISKNTPLGIAKSVDSLASSDGSYILTYKVIVKNYGTTDIDSLQLTDDLAEVFSNNTEFALLGAPIVSDSSKLKVNPDFDGDQDKNLLIADSSKLEANASDTLTFKVKVANFDSEPQTYLNTVIGNAWIGDSLVTDKSVEGTNPDLSVDGNPGNDEKPTGITIAPMKEDTSAVSVMVSEGLSINGDTRNEILVIKDRNNKVTLTVEDNIEVLIYNRWGHLIYKTDNYIREVESGKAWDGTTNTGIKILDEKYVPDGTYYYVITSTNKRLFNGKPAVGFITVIK
jgi:uncharacterized repeat protein (TIGR01451 family)